MYLQRYFEYTRAQILTYIQDPGSSLDQRMRVLRVTRAYLQASLQPGPVVHFDGQGQDLKPGRYNCSGTLLYLLPINFVFQKYIFF